jgi:hypothetical protein
MKKFIFVLAISFFMIGVDAQDAPTIINKKNEIGLHAGATTGLGLSYRRWIGKVGIQLTGLPIKTDNFTFISGGATLLYNFYDAQYVRVFGYLGGHYYMDKHTDEKYNPSTGDFDDHPYEDSFYNFGFGPGFAFGSVVRFNLMIGYGFYDVTDAFNMYPTGEIGIYFRFN